MTAHRQRKNFGRTVFFLLSAAGAILITGVVACAPLAKNAGNVARFPFEDPALPMDARAADLVSRMTLEEKVSQMQMDAPAIERLDIPAYHWWNEALHGVARNGAATVFPQAIGMAAAWDPALHHRMAQVIGLEARAKYQEEIRLGNHGIYKGLDLWAPNINIFRDPRWGRGQETYGEDPYLTSRLAIAFVTGIQGDDPTYFQAIATPKHFDAHSGPESERHRLNVVVSNRDLWSTYLPAFEAAVREGHAYSIMGAYTRLNGVPCCGNPMLLTDILRRQWGFQGFVVSDVGAVADIYLNHQVAGSPEEAAVMAVRAGCDLNSGTVYKSLVAAVRMGMIRESEIDVSVKRLMLGRLRMGMFDSPPTTAYAQVPLSAIDSVEHEALARKVAGESMVLLKNEGNLLPLKKLLRTIAVIGPTADDVAALVGNYNGTPSRPVTILQGIRNAMPPTSEVTYTPGCPLVPELLPLEETVPSSCLFTDIGEKVHGLKGNYYNNIALAGRPFRTRYDSALDFDWSVPSPRETFSTAEKFSASWTGVLVPPTSGPYQIGIIGSGAFRVYFDGGRIVDDWTAGPKRTVGARINLEAGRAYPIRVEYFHNTHDPVIQLCWTRPESEPFYADAVRAAQNADAVVMVLGLTAGLEREQATSAYTGFTGGDRQTLDLPSVQEDLLEAVSATGKPVVLVLTGGSALSINWAAAHTPAILEAWYPGEQGGNAVADVLFGDRNPGGKLPITFYKSVKDLPPFEDYSMEDRTYRYFHGEPLWPFGFGLSYTTFGLQHLEATPTDPTTQQDVTVRVNVRNTGPVAGDEVVQLYLSRPDAKPDDPIRSLQGFQRVHLDPGQEQTVEFTLTPYQLATVDDAGQRWVNPGPVNICVGTSSVGGQTKTLHLTGDRVTPVYRFVAPRLVHIAK